MKVKKSGDRLLHSGASGLGSRLEPVRYAAVNRLLVNLGYAGRHRLIEPYSLRRSKVGNILLYGIRAKSGENRSYRTDRIQSVAVTTHPFTPRFVVEFPAAGSLPAPPSPSRRSYRSPRTTHAIRHGVCRSLYSLREALPTHPTEHATAAT